MITELLPINLPDKLCLDSLVYYEWVKPNRISIYRPKYLLSKGLDKCLYWCPYLLTSVFVTQI